MGTWGQDHLDTEDPMMGGALRQRHPHQAGEARGPKVLDRELGAAAGPEQWQQGGCRVNAYGSETKDWSLSRVESACAWKGWTTPPNASA
eukprot:8018873-Alexandrium_andersonii.AAC.1